MFPAFFDLEDKQFYYVKKKEQVLRQEAKAASSAGLFWRRWQFTDYLQKTRDQRQKAAAEPDKVV